MIIEGMRDSYFYSKQGLSSWDVCPGDALLTSMGGKVTGLDLKPFDYRKDLKVIDGTIFSKTPNLWNETI